MQKRSFPFRDLFQGRRAGVTAMRLLLMSVLLCSSYVERSRAQTDHAERSETTARDMDIHGEALSNLTFEVISIKPSSQAVPFDERLLPDGFRKTRVTLSWLILMAYFPAVLWNQDRLKNAPDWTMTDAYDIEGKVSPEDVAEWQKYSGSMLDNKALESALQAALKSRCKLIVHRIPAEIEGYDLLVAKRGPQPKLTSPDEVFPSSLPHLTNGSTSGTIVDRPRNSTKVVYYNDTMDHFASSFGAIVADSFIQNKTGLIGRYDIVVDDAQPFIGGDDSWLSMPPDERFDLKAAGLRLQKTMVPTTTLVIDHIERPSPN